MKNADLRQLALLCELIDTQSLNEAAARLHMSASAASHALNRLRHELGDEVCIRDQQRYQLTPYGEAALAPLQQIVDLWREVSSSARLFEPGRCEDRMRMLCDDGLGLVALADFFRDTLAQAPGMRLDIATPAHGAQDIEELRAGRVDLVCSHHEAPPDARDLHMETLRRLCIDTCCLRADHPRIRQAPELAQWLAEEQLAVAGLDRVIDRLLAERGLPGRRASTVGSWALCARMLACTDRVAATSSEQAATLVRTSPGLRCLPLPGDGPPWPEVPVYLLWHQRTHQSPAHRWLRQRVRAHLAGGVAVA